MSAITQPARSEAYPELSPELWRGLLSYSVAEDVREGDVLFAPGQSSYELILIERGAVRLVRAQSAGLPDVVVVEFGSGDFIGELSLLTGQATYLAAVVAEPGRVHRIAPEVLRRLMDEGAELSDVLLRAMLARRRLLQGGEAARSVEILGSALSASALALRTTPRASSCRTPGPTSTARPARRSRRRSERSSISCPSWSRRKACCGRRRPRCSPPTSGSPTGR
jgi:thioredoxin reductase (NADPH)